MTRRILLVLFTVLAFAPSGWAQRAALPDAKLDPNGFRTHQVASEFQAAPTNVRVLLPDRIDTKKPHRVLYVLPVVATDRRKHGDGLLEIKKSGLHNTHSLICVAPEFTAQPWFADHDSNMAMRDESHLLKVVLPLIERTYPVRDDTEGRLLLGFSKSGWGAFTLLLRNPEIFHRAAGWDTGIRVDMGPIEQAEQDKRIARNFGSRKNFEEYRLSNLLKTKGSRLGSDPRLFYYNTEGNRAVGGAKLHQLMVELNFPHRYRFEPKRKHRWDSGWIPTAVDFLTTDPPQ